MKVRFFFSFYCPSESCCFLVVCLAANAELKIFMWLLVFYMSLSNGISKLCNVETKIFIVRCGPAKFCCWECNRVQCHIVMGYIYDTLMIIYVVAVITLFSARAKKALFFIEFHFLMLLLQIQGAYYICAAVYNKSDTRRRR